MARTRTRSTERDREERKWRVLTKSAPSLVQQIADAVVIKEGNVFFLSAPDGSVPLKGTHGYGLYYHDCRFVDGYEMRLNQGARPIPLVSSSERGFAAIYELTNPDLRMSDNVLIPKDTIGIRWERTVSSEGPAQHETISFVNFNHFSVDLDVELGFACHFEDVFEVRGLLIEQLGHLYAPRAVKDKLHFAYRGRDKMFRAVNIHFFPQADEVNSHSVTFRLRIEPEQRTSITLSICLQEGETHADCEPSRQVSPEIKQIQTRLSRESDAWAGWGTQVETDNMLFNRIFERSVRDLRMLESCIAGESFFAAGIPWFGTLFGRDSSVTALQTLFLRPSAAANTLEVLSRWQGTKVDDWHDEAPGKMLHELRVGELTRMGEIPYSPYYGTVDATPLFLILMGQYMQWVADERLWKKLSDNVHRALDWMREYGDTDHDGFLDYRSASHKGLINQGWKDSGNAMVNKDASLAVPPIAPAEVQGYAYLAQRLLGDLMGRLGRRDESADLLRRASEFKTHFNEAFWMADRDCYAMALQNGGRPCAVISSNAGQVLFGEIADHEKAEQVAKKLLSEDMFSGWGVRTLSSHEAAYNPLGYHLGTVWPHDNSLIAAGLVKYALFDQALTIFTSILDAAAYFRGYRLPELFTGFSRADYGIPVNYLVACHPQAWAAGSIPFMLASCLGLHPDAMDDKLDIVHPILPTWLNWVTLTGMRVGSVQVDLRFRRSDGRVDVDCTVTQGKLDVEVGAGV